MKAHVANYSKVNQLVRVCKHMHQKSDWAWLEFNVAHVRKNLMNAVRMDGNDALYVEDDEGKITGILLAAVDQFFINKKIYATDIHFMCDKGGIQLFAEFKRWAREHGANMIIMGIANDDTTGRVHKFYEMVGMKPIGDAWVLELEDKQEMAA
jgi:hypothetical protein